MDIGTTTTTGIIGVAVIKCANIVPEAVTDIIIGDMMKSANVITRRVVITDIMTMVATMVGGDDEYEVSIK